MSPHRVLKLELTGIRVRRHQRRAELSVQAAAMISVNPYRLPGIKTARREPDAKNLVGGNMDAFKLSIH